MFNMWLILLFEYKLINKSFLTNTQWEYCNLFLFGLSESRCPFPLGGFYQEDFIVYVVLLTLQSILIEKFVDFRFI